MDGFDNAGGTDWSFGGGSSGMLLPQLQAAYQRDPRRQLIQSIMQQGQQSLQQPTLSPGAALAKALTVGLGGVSSAMLESDYQKQNEGAQGTLRDALAAMNGTPAAVGSDGLPTDAGKAPDMATATRILASNPVTAPTALQQGLSNAQLRSKALIDQDSEYLKSGMQPVRDTHGNLLGVVKVSGYGAAKADAAGQVKGAETAADLAAQATGQPAVIAATTGPKAAQAGAVKGAETTSELAAQTAGQPGLIAATTAPKAAQAAAIAGAEETAKNPALIARATAEQSFKDDADPIKVAIGGVEYSTTKGALRQWQQQHGMVGADQLGGGTGGATPAAAAAPASSPPPASGGAAAMPPPPPPKPPVPPQGAPGAAPPPAAAASPPAPAAAPGAAAGAPQGLATFGSSPANVDLFKSAIEKDADLVSKARETAQAGMKDVTSIQAIQDFLPKVATGWSAETKLEAGRILKAAGVPDANIAEFTGTDVGKGQFLTKKFLELSSAAARQMGAREPGSVIQMFGKAYPNMGTDANAIRLQGNVLTMDRLWSNKYANDQGQRFLESVNDARSSGNYKGFGKFDDEFRATNDPVSYMHAAEAMSGMKEAWEKSDPQKYDAIVGAMPPGTRYMGPDNHWRVRQK